MNVGGHRLTNEDLRGHFAAMGFGEVACFRASGNVVFAAPAQSPREIATRIEQGLAGLLGYEVPTFIRSAPQLREIATAQPFTAEQLAASAGRLQVGLLSASASPGARKDVLALAGEDDSFAFGECELYWLPSGGILDSPLDLKAIGKLLGMMSVRTKNTIEQIAAKHFAE